MSGPVSRPNGNAGSTAGRQRLDQWLWHARIFKSRSLAARQCRGRKVRVNGIPGTKASLLIAPGDVLTLPKAGRVRIFRVLALGKRRGPAAEAQQLYEDISPPPPPREERVLSRPPAARAPGDGRPTKKERRDTDRLKGD
jgi:ribosome-associated heat shock protein Hsp15